MLNNIFIPAWGLIVGAILFLGLFFYIYRCKRNAVEWKGFYNLAVDYTRKIQQELDDSKIQGLHSTVESHVMSFAQQLPEIITSMDVDTTRFTEYIWGQRASLGADSTGAFLYRVVGSENTPIAHFIQLFDKYKLTGRFVSSIVWRGFMMEPENPRMIRLMVSLTKYAAEDAYALVVAGDEATVKEIEAYFLETYQAPTIKKLSIITGVSSNGSFRTHDRIITPDTMDVGHNEFYPNLEGGIEKLARDFVASKQNLMLIVGPPGTGKTTLIRTMMLLTNYELYGVCNDQNALESPELTSWISSFPSESLVSIEDADTYVAARKNGNKNMSALLNLTDGVMQSSRKLVIATNLENLKDVDEALLRPGRAFKVLHIGLLSIQEANKARAAIELCALPEDISQSKLTLAEALNYESVHNNVDNMARKVVGFGS